MVEERQWTAWMEKLEKYKSDGQGQAEMKRKYYHFLRLLAQREMTMMNSDVNDDNDNDDDDGESPQTYAEVVKSTYVYFSSTQYS